MPEVDEQNLVAVERAVLRCLCQGTPQGSVMPAGRRLLKHYPWSLLTHRIIFEGLVSLKTDDPETLRQQLPAKLTRRGFPDVDWGLFDRSHKLTKEEAEKLMKKLRDSA